MQTDDTDIQGYMSSWFSFKRSINICVMFKLRDFSDAMSEFVPDFSVRTEENTDIT